MPDRSWKRRERQVAKALGTTRKAGSGSQGQKGQTRSDSNHSRLYVEVKERAAWAVLNLWDDTAVQAKLERKTPVVVLCQKGKRGRFFLVRDDHVQTLAAELAAGQPAPQVVDWPPLPPMPPSAGPKPKTVE